MSFAALVVPGHLLFNMLIAILQGGTIFNFHVLFGVLYLSSWYEVLFPESSLSI